MKRRDESLTGNGGVTIKYEVYEPEDTPRGVLVISHGLGEHGRRYEHVAQRLSRIGLLVVVPDHRGHGRSDGPRAGLKRFADYTEDLDRVITQVRVPELPTFLLGHSMGGTIALDYALQHQDSLSGLILSAAAVQPGSDQPKLVLTIAKVLSRFAPSLPTAKLGSAGISRDPQVVAAYEADPQVFHGKVPAGLGGGLLRVMDTFPGRLSQLRIPVLLLHGGDDIMTAPAGTQLVFDRVSSTDKQITIYDGLYHEIFNEPEQDVVLDEVTRWLLERA